MILIYIYYYDGTNMLSFKKCLGVWSTEVLLLWGTTKDDQEL